MSSIFPHMLPLLGGDHIELDKDWLQEEEAWATQHAMRWAISKKFEPLEAAQFGTYFAEGWIRHLQEESSSVDAAMMQLIRQFRKEKEEKEASEDE